MSKKRYFQLFLLLLLLWFGYNAISIRYYSKHFYDRPSDVAIVLGAGTNDGKLSRVYEERVLHAINLLKAEKVRKIIFTGGFGEGQALSDSQAAKAYALQHDVSAEQILIEETSTITFENIYYAKKIMEENDFSTALIISDPYHMKRSMAMCDVIGVEALPSPTPTSMYQSRKVKFKFLMKEALNYFVFQVYGQFRSLD